MFEEIFAEKLRAMSERGRPRDLYDIVLLFRHRDLQAKPKIIKSVLEKKCESKGVSVPTLESIQNSSNKDELISEWENMLGHQLPALPPFEQFWEELPNIFNWLNQIYAPPKVPTISTGENEDLMWEPPQTVRQWGLGVPLESIRFAAVNHLCVELGYKHKVRLIEPYSLRRTKDGHLILHAIKVATNEHRCYRVDSIESIKVTTRTFTPRYEIEFSPVGTIHASPTPQKSKISSFSDYKLNELPHRPSSLRTTSSHGMKHIFQCGLCQKKFTKSKYDVTLREHKNSLGMNCPGKIGFFVGNK